MKKDRTPYNYDPLSRRALIQTNINLNIKFVYDKPRNVEISTPRARNTYSRILSLFSQDNLKMARKGRNM